MKFIPVFANFLTFKDSPRQPYIKAHDTEYDGIGERGKYYERKKEKKSSIIDWNCPRLALRMTKRSAHATTCALKKKIHHKVRQDTGKLENMI